MTYAINSPSPSPPSSMSLINSSSSARGMNGRGIGIFDPLGESVGEVGDQSLRGDGGMSPKTQMIGCLVSL